jgi:hypothetical protein
MSCNLINNNYAFTIIENKSPFGNSYARSIWYDVICDWYFFVVVKCDQIINIISVLK